MSGFDVEKARAQFPALSQEIDGCAPVFFDGPGGTQVPQMVLDAITGYLGRYNSNLLNSPFFAVQKTHEVVRDAREKAAIFINSPDPETIIFGANMSSITAHLSRSVSLEWDAGDEIIVTALDHYSNVSFWQRAAQDRGATCHMVRANIDDCTLDYDHLEELISPKTKFVAVTLASNFTGSRVDAKRVIKLAKSVGAIVYVDSVHAAPHFLPDVQDLDPDFLACSVYKFYGPHLGFVYGKKEHLERLTPYKLEPAPDKAPDCWEVGTKSFEALAGLSAAIDYMGSFYKNSNLRGNLKAFYKDIFAYEKDWSRAFLERAATIKGMKIYGITDPDRLEERSPTFAFTIDGVSPQEISEHLAKEGISAGASHFYANALVDALGLDNGAVRAGALHYNTLGELDRFFKALERL